MVELSNHLPDPKERDWHAQRSEDEPRCSADQWRQRDRGQILYISEMADRHLGHCIRFASTKPQHRSRLSALLTERSARTALNGEPRP
jgi:hypothetical protein